MRTPGVPSGTHCLGLVNHLAHVERFMFLGEDADWPATFQAAESVIADYEDAVARAHLIEETARHAGHLDILREQIEGTEGR